jgi:hypothetical protein
MQHNENLSYTRFRQVYAREKKPPIEKKGQHFEYLLTDITLAQQQMNYSNKFANTFRRIR